jgi:methionine-gamma-lyase
LIKFWQVCLSNYLSINIRLINEQILGKIMKNEPANRVQDYLVFGEFGGVNPSIEDSSTFTFMSADKMKEIFEHEIEGCFLYSRHLNPTDNFLARALAEMEGSEMAKVTASGMSAIACTVLQICSAGDEIVSSRTIYGGTYALFKNVLPRFNINTRFINIVNHEDIRNNITPKTKILYCESLSNPMLEVADFKELRKIADEYGLILVVDNTFTPMIISPLEHGAHIVIHSLTKYINGSSDCIGGAICAKQDFIASLRDVNTGVEMLLGPTMDSLRAASILKNLRTLHVRMHQHSKNTMYVAENLVKLGLRVIYPGLKAHQQHELMKTLLNPGFGFSGIITLDAKDEETSLHLLETMQNEHVGYFAVSLGFYKTLFSSPGTSTSSEIPEEEQISMGMTRGLVRFSIGLDNDIERSFGRIEKSLKIAGLIS